MAKQMKRFMTPSRASWESSSGETFQYKAKRRCLLPCDRWRIVRQYSSGPFSQRHLATEYAVSRSTIRAIVSGRTWPFVGPQGTQEREWIGWRPPRREGGKRR